MISQGPFGDGDGVARFKKCSFLIGEENSSEDEELRSMVVLDGMGLTLIRAVLRMGRDGCEVIVDFVIVKVVVLEVLGSEVVMVMV